MPNPHHIVTPEMRAKFVEMVGEYYNYDKKESEQWVNDYEKESLYTREQMRKPVVGHFLKKAKYEGQEKIPDLETEKPQPPAYTPPKGKKPAKKGAKTKTQKPAKWVEISKYSTSVGDLNPKFVEYAVNKEENKFRRFVYLGKDSGEHYYDVKTDKELTRRQYDNIRKTDGVYL